MSAVATTCPFCAVGCGLALTADGDTLRVRPIARHPVSRGQLCAKGWSAAAAVRHPERLSSALLRDGDRLVPVPLERALDAAADAIRSAVADGGPDAVGIIASARATNEDAFAAMKLARATIGTNNVDHCARVCHAPSVAGLTRTLGSGAMTSSIDDIDRAELLFVVGSDTTENHPIIGARMLAAQARGARLVVVDPRRTRLARLADVHLPLRLGTDIPLLNGMIRLIFTNGWQDDAYLAERCENVDAVRAAVEPFTLAHVARVTGLDPHAVMTATRLYATTRRAFLAYCLGVTQHVCGTENVIALSNLALVTGHVGIEGAGINPLRGQNNVQGACDMGALPDVLSGYQRVEDGAARGRFERAWGRTLPSHPGLTAPAMQRAAHDGALRCMLVLGEDPVVTDAAQHTVRRALGSLDTLIVADLFLTETAKLADVVLPAASFAEKDGTFTSTERRVQRVRRVVAPPGDARADWQLLDAIATRLGRPLGFDSAERIFAEMAHLTPIYAGMSWARLEQGFGLQWPCPSADHPGTPILHRDHAARGRARLIPVVDTPPAELPDAEYPLQLTTCRLHHQYGCGSMTRRAPLLERENPPGLLWIHPDDAAARGIRPHAKVLVRSRRGELTTHAMLSADVPAGVVAMPYHFAETPSNLLTSDALDPISRMPELKVCAVDVVAAPAAGTSAAQPRAARAEAAS
ncbi:formate dehydrogenase subunit alpha [Candidatus Binatia bacterium]|nr:formate dehydrogenase subunit alpha [Candidatus Binatia bacterium]